MNSKITQTVQLWLTALIMMVPARSNPRGADQDSENRDRGDVPGWVMITVMTVMV